MKRIFIFWCIVLVTMNSYASSSSKSASSSSRSSSTTSSLAAVARDINMSWSVPTQRENGTPLAKTEIGGYQIRVIYAITKPSLYIPIPGTATSYVFRTTAGVPVARVEIAVYDTNGLYSKFIEFKDGVPPPKVKNLKLIVK